jgi:hypothetical protein
MTDRELLELAAKACGLEEAKMRIEFNQWNPLTDDGDALLVMVKLGIDIAKAQVDYWDKHSNDPYAATRRAITRAAAEIGRNMT